MIKSIQIYLMTLFVLVINPFISIQSNSQRNGEFYIAYIAEEANVGRSIVAVTLGGENYQKFVAPEIPGRYFNGLTSSQDGDRLAFMRDVEGIDKYSIWRMNADGTGLLRLTQKGKVAMYPSMSADGSRVAFTRFDDGVWEIFTINYDGSNLKKVSNFKQQGKQPRWGVYTSWSPDGDRIVYSVSFGRRFSEEEIYLMNDEGGDVKQLTNNEFQDTYPDFSPNGQLIAFNSTRNGKHRETYVLNLESGETYGLGNFASIFGLSWSPDGKKIAYSGANHGRSDIYIMDANGANQVRLSYSDGLDLSPTWVKSY